MPPVLRIFVSSPGDVIPERRRANLVIEKLAKTYARFFSIEAILWEVEPMLASGHFQDQITPPSETDILILIVWSRLGTALPQQTETREYRGIDGRVPVTGTEWEFEDALAAQKQHGAPDLLAYRKRADPLVSISDKSAVATAEEQWDRLDVFWNRWFVDRGEFRAAFGEFADLDSFEGKLESDLRVLIERRVQALRATGHEPATAIWLADSPFRGLDTYRFEHAPIFFGRSSVTKMAVEQLTGNAESGRAFLLILGASGAGKSSLAQAGVLPALTGRGIVPRVGLWRHAVVHPGGHHQGPFEALAEALVSKSALPELLAPNQDAAALARHLRAAADDPCFPIVAALNQIESVSRAHGDLLEIEATRLALVADQLEELFTASEVTAADRVAFICCLDSLARSGRVFVIATMRNDYWHRASETPRLIEMAAGSGRLDLLPPAKDEIYEMIRQPAEAAGIEFESDPTREVRLDATLGAEAEANPGVLPLLSFLLDELYKADVKDGGGSTLTYASMQKLGGLTGAIANRAEAAFTALPAEVQAALPKVLRTLVTVSRAGADATARVAPMSRFPAGSPERRLVDALLDPHVRLMVAEGDGEGARVRLAHEALITNWERAKRQIAQDRDDLRVRAAVEEALVEWRGAIPRNKHAYLLRDPQLANAVDLAERWRDELDDETIGFVDSSQRRARLLHRLTMAAAAVFAAVAIVAGVATYFADRERLSAERETTRAQAQEARAQLNQSRFLANLADNLRGQGYPAPAVALSLEALPDSRRGNVRPYLLEAERSLFSALQTLRERATLRGHTDTITNVAFSPDGHTLLTSSWDHHVKLWDTASWSQTRDLYDNNGAVTIASFSPDGRSILVAPSDGTARIFDVATGAVLRRLAGTGDELSDGSYSPDGTRIFTAAEDKNPRLWDASSGRLLAVLSGHADKVTFGAFSPDSSIVVTVGAEQAIRAWQASDGHFLFDIAGLHSQIDSVAFSPNGRYLASAGADGTVELWDAGNGKPVRTMTAGINGWASWLAFSPDGERLAAAYGDHIVRVWQVSSGQQILQLKGHTDDVLFVGYSPDGRLIATTSSDKTARLWNAQSGGEIAVFRGHGSPVRRAAFSSDGQWLASVSGQGADIFSSAAPDNTARIWNVHAALEIGTVREPRHILEPAAVSPKSGLIAVRDADASGYGAAKLSAPAQLWDADTYADLGDLRVGDASVTSAIASPDGSRVATVERNGDLHLWDAATAASVAVYHSSDSSAAMAAFSLDGSLLAVALTPRNGGAGEHPVVVLRSGDGGQLAMLRGLQDEVGSMSFAPDGKHLLATDTSFGSDHGFRVWPVADGSDATAVVKDENISAATFTEGGAAVLTADENGKVRTWQSETGVQISEWDPPSDFGSASTLGPGGRVFVTPMLVSGDAPTLRVVEASTGHEQSVATPDNEAIDHVIFAADGSRFAGYSESGRILVWQTADGKLVGDLPAKATLPLDQLISSTQPIVQISNDGRFVAVGAADGTIELREVGFDKEPLRLEGHTEAVTSIAFAPDDRLLVSGSADTTARVWEVASGKQIAVLQSHGTSVASVTFVASNRRILTLGSEAPAVTPQDVLIADGESGKITTKVVIPGTPADAGLAFSTQSSLAFSQMGDRLVVNDALVFDATSGKLLFSPPAIEDFFVEGTTTSPSGKLVAWKATAAGAAEDAPVQVQVADVASGKVIKTLSIAARSSTFSVDSGLTGATTFAFAPDDHYLNVDNRIFSIETGEEWREPTGGENARLSYSEDGKLLAVVAKAPAAVDPLENAAALTDPRSGRTLFTLRGNGGPVSAIAVDPSDKLVATAANDDSVKLWNADSGRQTGLIDLKPPDQESSILDSNLVGSVSRMAISPDAHRLAIADDAKIHIWDIASRTEVGSVAIGGNVDRLAYSPDGRLLAASFVLGFQGLLLSNASDLTPVPIPPWKPQFVNGSPFAFSPDGRRLVTTPGGTQALVFDTRSGAVVATLRGHNYEVTALAYSPDGRWIATGAADDKLHLWDADTFGETVVPTGHMGGVNDVAFSPDSRTIAVAGKDKTISLWDVEQRTLLRKLVGHEDEVKSVKFIDGGKKLVSVGADRTIRTWNIDTGEQISEIVHRGDITAFAITDNFIASANSEPREQEQRFELSLWDTADRRKLELQHQQGGGFKVLLSPDRRYLLTVPDTGSKDDALALYDVNAGKLVGRLALADTQIGGSAVFAPDGDSILTYGAADSAFAWRTSDAAFLGQVQGQARKGIADLLNGPSVYNAEFVAAGRRFLTYSDNGIVRLWDFASLRLLAAFYDSDVRNYQFALDGRRLISTEEDGSVHISELPNSTQELVDLACRLLPGPLTKAERQAYGLDPNPDHYPCDRKPLQ